LIKAVIFDMDGLMFDTERLLYQAWDYAGEKMNIGKAGHMAVETLGISTADSQSIWYAHYGEAYNQQELRRYTYEFMETYYKEKGIPIKKGLQELLAYLKKNGYRTAVATSSSRVSLMRNLTAAGLKDEFDAFVTSDMVKVSKPSPDIYLKACELLELQPEECMALEDSLNGIKAAAGAKCKAIMIPDLVQPNEETEKMLFAKCEHLGKVIEVLEKIKRQENLHFE